MRARNIVWALPGVLFVFGACGGSSTPSEVISCDLPGACALEIVSGDGQTGPVAAELPQRFVVRLVHPSGQIPPPVTVDWTVVSGEGTIRPDAPETNDDQQVSALAQLGRGAGPQVFQAAIREGEEPNDNPTVTVQFNVTAEPGPGRELQPVSGGDQTGTVGQALGAELVVRAVDAFGNPVEGVRVAWDDTLGGGSVEALALPTDADGLARAVATLGTAAGINRFQAEAPRLQGQTVGFLATGVPDVPAQMTVVVGDNQAGARGQVLPEPLTVQVTDQYDNPVEGTDVTFSSLTPMGLVAPETVTTDEEGEAGAIATLGGEAGVYLYRAAIDAVSIEFTATAFPELCSADDWCWVAPIPQGNTINDSYTVSPTDVWVVGDYGTILRWNGAAWQGFNSVTTRDLNGIYGAGRDQVWAVGDAGTVLFFDGDDWRNQSVPATMDLNSVAGTSASDVVAVGAAGTILRYDGMMWSDVSIGPGPDESVPPDLNAVWSSPAASAIVGNSGIVLFAEGSGWRRELLDVGGPDVSDPDLFGVWGTGPNEVWLVGERSMFAQWFGAGFLVDPSFDNEFRDPTLRDVWGTDEDNIFAVGDRGRVRRYDGTVLRPEISRTGNDVRTVTGTNQGVIALGEGGLLMRRPMNDWQLETGRRLNDLEAIWGTARDNIWAVGTSATILRWDGQRWVEIDTGVNTSRLLSIHGSGPNDVWAVGQGADNRGQAIFRYIGETRGWEFFGDEDAAPLSDVHSFSSTVAWAVGDEGTILRWDGDDWNEETALTSRRLNGVWGARQNDVWAVGDSGTILRYDGSAWTEQTSPVVTSLQGISGTSATNVWAFGAGGTLIRFDGNEWSVVNTGVTNTFFAIHFTGPDDIWLAGLDGVLLRRQSANASWIRQESGTRNRLLGVFGAVPEDLWLVGDTGAILRRNP